MDNVLIVGCGVIGGSIIKRLADNTSYKLSCFDLNQATVKEVTENYNCSFSDQFVEFEHIILCVPIKHTFDYLDLFQTKQVKATIYDCSSTKLKLEVYARSRGLNYVGFHPMCGSERAGFAHSSSELFVNKRLIATEATAFIQRLSQDLDGDLIVMESSLHDQLTAQISHMPQLISLLLNCVDDEAKEIAGPGFRDMTRISNSQFVMWEDILKTNNQNIVACLKGFNANLEELILCLEREQYDRVETWFKN